MVQDKKRTIFFFLQSDRTSPKSRLKKKQKNPLLEDSSCQDVIGMEESERLEERPQNQKINASEKFYLMRATK